MTRETAIAANWALLNLDGFNDMACEIKEAVVRAEDMCQVSLEFKAKLDSLLEEEFHRLEKVLEDL